MNTITGFDELSKKLSSLVKSTEKIEDEVLIEAAQPIADTARSLARRRTGQGADSIHVSEVQQDGDEKFVRVGPGEEGWYMFFQEVGTSHAPAHPFLRPAYDQHESSAQRLIGDRLGRNITREAEKL